MINLRIEDITYNTTKLHQWQQQALRLLTLDMTTSYFNRTGKSTYQSKQIRLEQTWKRFKTVESTYLNQYPHTYWLLTL